MRFTKTLCALVSSTALAAFGQVTNQNVISLTLEEAIQRAMEHNLGLQIESLNPAIFEYNLRAAYAGWDPLFSSEASRRNTEREGGGFNTVTGNPFPATTSTEFDTLSASITGLVPTGMRYTLAGAIHETTAVRPGFDTNGFFGNVVTDTWDAQASITVQQPLLRDFWTDATRTTIKLAKRDVKISELQLQLRTMDLITQVEKAYYELLFARENIKVSEADLGVKQRLFNENRRRVEVGTMAPLDERQAQSEVALARTALLNALSAAEVAENNLRTLITDDYINQLDRRLEPTDKLTDLPPILNLQDSFGKSMENRPELAQARLALEQRDIRLKYDFNQLFPRLDVFASWGVNGLDTDLSGAFRDVRNKEFQQDSVGVLFSFPLSNQRERANRKISRAQKAQAILQLKAQEESIVKQVHDSVREVRYAYDRIGLTREATVYAVDALEAARKKLEAGKATSFEVLELASALTAARFEEVRALRDYNRALADLSFAEGTTFERRRMDWKVK